MTEQIIPSPASMVEFGVAVAVSRDGSTLVITAPLANGGKGFVYVYTGPGFATQTILAATGGTSSDNFGVSVGVSDDGTVIAVGAPAAVSGAGKGKVWIFHGPAWGSQTVVTGSDLAGPSDNFGISVAVSGDGTVVGAGADGWASSKGKAYLYHGASWGTEKKLTGTSTTSSSQFGSSVALSTDGSVAAVGAQNDPPLGITHGAGKVFVYNGANWVTETVLTAATPIVNGQFGTSVAISGSGSILAVGAPPFSGAGKAYIKSGPGWATETILTASDGHANDDFGRAVAISDDGLTVVVGASFGGSGTKGQAYIRDGAAYADETILAASDGTSGDEFGYSVGATGPNLVVVGAFFWGPGGSGDGTGQAYVYTSSPPPSPPVRGWRIPGQGRIIVTDLTGVVTTWLDNVHLGAQILSNLNQPSTITVALRPNNPAVYTLFTDGDPLVAQSNRLVYVFLREQPSSGGPWVCRAAGTLMSPQDQGDADVPTTHFVAYDPWQYIAGRPFYSDTGGSLPGPDGFLYPVTRGGVIIATALKNAIESDFVGCFVDAGPAYGGTVFWDGVIEDTPILDYQVQQGQSVADVWNGVIAAGDPSGGPGGADIILTPIYDPVRRPGYTHELSVYNLAGTVVPASPMAWGEFTRVSTTADRQHDGTPGAFINQAYYYAGQGGFPVGLIDNPASVAKYQPYRDVRFFPQQIEGDVVAAFAHQAITLAKQGKRTFTVDPDPMRAPAPFTGYNLGDRIPQLAPRTLRVEATGYQRIQTIPLEISPDGVTRVRSLLTTPDWRGDTGT